jgi:HSP20 family protein
MAGGDRDRQPTDWSSSIVPERWRRLFDLDLEQEGSLRMEEYQDGDDLVLRAEIPGIDPDKDVEVVVADGRLVVRAHREAKEECRNKSGFHSEFSYGELSRSMSVPAGIDAGDITATYGDGILEVRLPVPTEQEPHQQRVTVHRK